MTIRNAQLSSTPSHREIKYHVAFLAPRVLGSSARWHPRANSGRLFLRRSINGEEVQLLLKTADGRLMQLSATPVSEAVSASNVGGKGQQQTVVIKTEPALRCAARSEPKRSVISRLSLAKMVIHCSAVGASRP